MTKKEIEKSGILNTHCTINQCKELGLTVKQVKEACKNGDVKFEMKGKHIFYDRKDISKLF